MVTAKWGPPATLGSNIAGATWDSLPDGATSAFVTHDNATDKYLYALAQIDLGSLTPVGSTAAVTLRGYAVPVGGTAPDNNGKGGETYTLSLSTATAAKVHTIKISLIGPFSLRFCLTNNAGVALAASGNSLKLQPFNEDVS